MKKSPRSTSPQILGAAFLLAPLVLAADIDWRKTRLGSPTPDGEVLHLDVDGDGKPDIIERWWNGKRVRWLDENGDMRPDDARGDQLADVLQVDVDGDGAYDGLSDINVKWADLDNNGVPDMQAFVINPPNPPGQNETWNEGEWMIFRNFDDRGVLGWMDWASFDWDCWGYTGTCNWLPNYHADTLFLKVHASVANLNDPTLNWENPFIFYDYDDDGLCDMAMRWVDDPNWRLSRRGSDEYHLTGFLDDAFVTFDLDGDSAKDNESDFDMSLRSSGNPGIDYRDMVQDVSGFVGNAKFDACFNSNVWRRLDVLRYMPPERSYEAFFAHDWEDTYFVFDEDDDDHRWERVEMYYPGRRWRRGEEQADIYSTGRWIDDDTDTVGLAANRQADSIGDRGEWDIDNSGRGKLYVGAFDHKLHLYGAEWGAWTVDEEGAFHGGWEAPPPSPDAPRVLEVVKYTDANGNGFIDTIEYDYDGDRTIDFRVNLLDYASEEKPAPDVVDTLNTRALGWRGLHDAFNEMAEDAWVEALSVYRAAWRRGLTTPEHDLLAFASSKAERYAESYWLKEKLFRHFRSHLAQVRQNNPANADALTKLEADLTRLYYTGNFEEYTKRIADIP